jgi:hypothetical protein
MNILRRHIRDFLVKVELNQGVLIAHTWFLRLWGWRGRFLFLGGAGFPIAPPP